MALTTRNDVKAALSVTGSTDDTFIDSLIERASAAVESYCRRTFGTRTVTQTFRLDRGRQRLILDAVPVTSITSVTEAGTALTADDYELDAGAGFLDRLDGDDGLSTWAASKIVIVFVAGYVLPGAGGTVTLPADIQAATIDLVARAYHARGRDPQLRSEKILDVIDQSFTAADSVTTKGGLPLDVAERLDPYREVSFG